MPYLLAPQLLYTQTNFVRLMLHLDSPSLDLADRSSSAIRIRFGAICSSPHRLHSLSYYMHTLFYHRNSFKQDFTKFAMVQFPGGRSNDAYEKEKGMAALAPYPAGKYVFYCGAYVSDYILIINELEADLIGIYSDNLAKIFDRR